LENIMKVLVTGGAGFIGSHVVDACLLAGHEVAVIDDLSTGSKDNVHPGVHLYEGDIRNVRWVNEVFAEFRPKWVSHQAAQMSVSRSVREPRFDAEVNILGWINVLSAATGSGVQRMVFASSGGVLYGDVPTPAAETAPHNPISPYGIAKLAGEKYLEFYCHEYRLPAIAMRYANVYGERQNPLGEAGVVAIFCAGLLQGKQCTINGDGFYIRDYVNVHDVVQANMAALQSQNGGFEAVNVGTGVGTDVNQLGELLRELCQEELRRRQRNVTVLDFVHGPPRAGDLRSNLVSYEKAARLWGWKPQIQLRDGLAQVVRWYADRLGI
jgi:UDP-glucose 4-epimerase